MRAQNTTSPSAHGRKLCERLNLEINAYLHTHNYTHTHHHTHTHTRTHTHTHTHTHRERERERERERHTFYLGAPGTNLCCSFDFKETDILGATVLSLPVVKQQNVRH